MKRIFFILTIIIVFGTLGGCNTTKRPVTPEIPPPSFFLTYHHVEPNRPVRKQGKMYREKIVDALAHLYPPSNNQNSREKIDKQAIQEIIATVRNAGVETIIVMPTPNDGLRPNKEMGIIRRKMARELDRETISIFCGSDYMTNWLNNAYRRGYDESELTAVLQRITQDSSEYIGVGELAFYHFDKGFGEKQHIIKFPPNFEPFLKILDLIEENGLWVVLHIEPVTREGVSYEDTAFGGLELILKRNSRLKLICSHAAMTNSSNIR